MSCFVSFFFRKKSCFRRIIDIGGFVLLPLLRLKFVDSQSVETLHKVFKASKLSSSEMFEALISLLFFDTMGIFAKFLSNFFYFPRFLALKALDSWCQCFENRDENKKMGLVTPKFWQLWTVSKIVSLMDERCSIKSPD